jgi:catalase
MSTSKVFTNATGAPVADNTNIMTAGPRGPALLQDIWLMEKMTHFEALLHGSVIWRRGVEGIGGWARS